MLPLLVVLPVLCGPVAGVGPPAGPPAVDVRYSPWAGGYAVRGAAAPAVEVALALGRVGRCRVELPEELEAAQVTLDLSPRPVERLLRVLALRLECRLVTAIRLLPEPETSGGGPRAFSRQPVSARFERAAELEAVLDALEVPVRAEETLRRRTVRVVAAREPLWKVLDHLVRRLRARWEVEVRLEPAGQGVGRAQAFYENLAALPAGERRQEIEAGLERIEALPGEERAPALRRLAAELVALEEMLKQVPGEHRGVIQGEIGALALDYQAALARARADRGEIRSALLPAVLRLQAVALPPG